MELLKRQKATLHGHIESLKVRVEVNHSEETYILRTLDQCGPIQLGNHVDNEFAVKTGRNVLHLRRSDDEREVIGNASLDVAHEHVMSEDAHGWVV